MKNTLHSYIGLLGLLSKRQNNLKLVLLFFGIFFIGVQQLSAQLPITYDFESGIQGWATQSNSQRFNNSSVACNGSYSLLSARNNNNGLFSPFIDLSSYAAVTISFCHQSIRLENGEGFILEYNDGSGFQTLQTYERGVDFINTGAGFTNNFSYTISTADYVLPANARFRFRGTANQNNEGSFFDDINIVVASPCTTPSNQPTNMSFNSITETTMNMSFTAATSNPDDYLVIINTSGVTPILSNGTTYNEGTTFSGNYVLSNDSETSFSISGLLENTTYYFYVFSYNSACSGGPNYNSINPLYDVQTTSQACSPTTANGTSELGCPSVDSGGVGLSGADPTPINCSVGSTTTTLEATYLDLGDTSSYSVESIAYNPPFQYGCLANPVSVNVDDVWSPVVNLPFDFCFYGNTYNSCVIGSNGVISFNTSLANSYSGWRFTQDIPSNSNSDAGYFGPSIYGVHHDVDPSQGGEIGYQLITLDSGCRALVASWFRVPMYYDNSILYTGMMVFYEDTNIIEVYVEEKNIDGYYSGHSGPWNYGNAIIGLQANTSVGIAAPGRNAQDTNWSTTNEAWRFTPNGSSVTELKWYENSISAANEIIDPDNDGQITVTPTSTTDYYAEVTYTLCNGTTFTETDVTTVTLTGSKVWDGSESDDWHDPDNWSPSGVPDITNCVVIPPTANDPRIYNNMDGTGFNMEIQNGADLLQRPNSTLTIDDAIIVDPAATYRIRNNASVIQIDDVTTNKNTGISEVRRRVNGVGTYDYVYWSTPVSNFNVQSISPGSSSNYIFNWIPTVANGTTGNHGTWVNTTEDMIAGKGYIVRGLSGTVATDQTQFEGVLNNGKISYPISRGSYTGADYAGVGNTATAQDDNWNLLGNPYPSAISLDDFVAGNPALDGTLYFWQHLTPVSNAISDPFYEDYVYNYSPNDYMAANSLGSTPSGFNGYIASGQGFFALMLDSAPTPNTVSYDNTMRGLYANDVFYRNSSTSSNQNKHRIWLDLVDQNNSAISILVGYADGATDDIDRLYDGFSMNESETQFYSVLQQQKFSIQGKGLPFEDSDTIPLGYVSPSDGNFTISINQLDGLFSNETQNVYLEDTELNIIHNLKANPYSFVTAGGTFNERFVLRFNNSTLGINDDEALSNLQIKKINQSINANSSLSDIMSFELYDLTGRVIHKKLNINNNVYNYKTQNLSTGAYIVKVQLQNGTSLAKKLVI